MAQTRVWCESYIFDNSRWSGQKVRGDAHISTSRSWARKARDSCLHGAPIRSRCFGAPGLMTLGNCIGPRLCRRDLLHCAARCRSPRAGCFSELYVSAPFQPAYSSFLCLSLSLYIYMYIHVPSFLIRSAPPRSSASVCEVVLLVDYIGSFSLRNDWVRELRSVGADVVGQGGGCLGCSGV